MGKYGDDADWMPVNFVTGQDMTDPDNYDYVTSVYNVMSLIDYYLLILSRYAPIIELNTACGVVAIPMAAVRSGATRCGTWTTRSAMVQTTPVCRPKVLTPIPAIPSHSVTWAARPHPDFQFLDGK